MSPKINTYTSVLISICPNSYARNHGASFGTVLFMLAVSSSYTFSEILSSNVTAGIPVLPWWTGKAGMIKTYSTINQREKKSETIMIN